MAPTVPVQVVIHPIVLLSTVDHYNRVVLVPDQRLIGILLGTSSRGVVDVTNSFAVPFEEDENDHNIWFLDHNFHEQMYAMFKKVNASENVVGWYSTGPKLRQNDHEIHQLLKRYTTNPVMVIIDVKPKDDLGIPTKAYVQVEEVNESSQEKISVSFQLINSEIGALEAEEVGVEHLLRDVKDTTISTLTTRVNEKMIALRSLVNHLQEMSAYLTKVVDGQLPINHQVIASIQDIFNLSPNLQVEEMVKCFAVKTNDMLLAIYLSSLIRSVISLHNLIHNKISNRARERGESLPLITPPPEKVQH